MHRAEPRHPRRVVLAQHGRALRGGARVRRRRDVRPESDAPKHAARAGRLLRRAVGDAGFRAAERQRRLFTGPEGGWVPSRAAHRVHVDVLLRRARASRCAFQTRSRGRLRRGAGRRAAVRLRDAAIPVQAKEGERGEVTHVRFIRDRALHQHHRPRPSRRRRGYFDGEHVARRCVRGARFPAHEIHLRHGNRGVHALEVQGKVRLVREENARAVRSRAVVMNRYEGMEMWVLILQAQE